AISRQPPAFSRQHSAVSTQPSAKAQTLTAVILSDGSLLLRTGIEEPLYRGHSSFPRFGVLPTSGRTIIQLITPTPHPLFFRISGLRTFSPQMIEPQRFTSKFFIS